MAQSNGAVSISFSFLHSVISLFVQKPSLELYYVDMIHLCINLEFVCLRDENMPVMLVAALNF